MVMANSDTSAGLVPSADPVVRRMRSGDLAAVAEILAVSFAGKMDAAMQGRSGEAARVFAYLALVGGDAWVADVGGVIGLVTFQDRARPWHAHAGWSLLRGVRPLRRRLRVMLYLMVFHSAAFPASELYLETVAVHPDARGKGVGRVLLRFADAEALRRRRASVSLYCIRENAGARALYIRHGYRLVRSEDLWWCSRLLGFRITDQMRRELSPEARI